MALFEENVFEFYMHLLQNINRSENRKFLHLMLETVYLLFHRDTPADLVAAHHDALTSKVRPLCTHLASSLDSPSPAEQGGLGRAAVASGAREEVQRTARHGHARCAPSTIRRLFRHHQHGRSQSTTDSGCASDSPFAGRQQVDQEQVGAAHLAARGGAQATQLCARPQATGERRDTAEQQPRAGDPEGRGRADHRVLLQR